MTKAGCDDRDANPDCLAKRRFVGVISGGKDSIYSICSLLDRGHALVALVYIRDKSSYSDSFMYQTVGSEFIEAIAECLGVPLFMEESDCVARTQELEYKETEGDEVEDLYRVLKRAREEIFYDAVCSGAILSNYQRNRVIEVCKRLTKAAVHTKLGDGKKDNGSYDSDNDIHDGDNDIHDSEVLSMTPLWKRSQKRLLREMIDYGMEARVVKVASSDLDKTFLNRNLAGVYEYLSSKEGNTTGNAISDREDAISDQENTPSCEAGECETINYCGEGGEYETITLDCKYFRKRIIPGNYVICDHPDNKKDMTGGVYYLKYQDIKLEDKARF